MTEFICKNCNQKSIGRNWEVKTGKTKFCSRTCNSSYHMRIRHKNGELSGNKNPNWKNGISKNHYHYKKLQVKRYPEKNKARQAVCRAVKSGKLIREPCQVCGDARVHAHHEDYSKPLEIQWFCRKHHREYKHDNKH